MNKVKQLQQKIVAAFQRVADPGRAERDRMYHKYDGWNGYGLTALVSRGIEKRFRKELGMLSMLETFDLAMLLVHSPMEEEKFLAVTLLHLHAHEFETKHLRFLDIFLGYLGSWSTIDEFAGRVLQALLPRFPQEIEALLRKWNKAQSMWTRRASVVAFTRKVGESGKYTNLGLELCDNLKSAPEDLVQKGVGWALKDLMRGDKKRVLAYVKLLRKERVPATITLYALRDLKGGERQVVLSCAR